MGEILHFTYPEVPPSENAIRQIRYVYDKAKRKAVARGMCYTTEAENYLKAFSNWARVNLFVDLQKFRKGDTPESVYRLHLNFHFPVSEVVNATWLKTGKGTPYKKMDVGNRRKLLEDCVADVTGIDDSRNFGVLLYKLVGDGTVEILLERSDPEIFGVPRRKT